MNEGSLFLFCFVLFCSYEIHPTGDASSDHVLGVLWKALDKERGAWAWVP